MTTDRSSHEGADVDNASTSHFDYESESEDPGSPGMPPIPTEQNFDDYAMEIQGRQRLDSDLLSAFRDVKLGQTHGFANGGDK